MKYIFSGILGIFIFDNQFNLVEERRFQGLEDYKKRLSEEDKLKKRYKDWVEVPEEKLERVLSFFKDKKYFDGFYLNNLELTKQKVKESVSNDGLITQAVSNMGELDKMGNVFVKRLREWYSLYLPEFSKSLENNEKFVELVVKRSKSELLKEIRLKASESMGADLRREDVEEMLWLGREILNLYELKQKHEAYLTKMMKSYCPNLLELAGVGIGAKLIELGKGLKHLALLPSSTVQLLGAEKALFRHIKTGSASPKYGVIINHSIIQKAKKEDKGKAARMLADKLSLCIRLDFFKGEFKALEYRKELEKKF